ncbi:hypothetical protein [Thermococcus indicus]|uniref:hypothetical protein n=1 Tax=Thermococcus indicus TaxID=2586643 RepID=UPI0019811E70|nr:hypothetical protein [Thermococcus indicus]
MFERCILLYKLFHDIYKSVAVKLMDCFSGDISAKLEGGEDVEWIVEPENVRNPEPEFCLGDGCLFDGCILNGCGANGCVIQFWG